MMWLIYTMTILSTGTDRPEHTMQIEMRLQSDQGPLCLPFFLHHLESLVKLHYPKFGIITLI